MTDGAVRGKASLDPAPWSLAAEGGDDRCAGWAFERRAGQAQKVTVDDPG
jgi:hypothetical protein